MGLLASRETDERRRNAPHRPGRARRSDGGRAAHPVSPGIQGKKNHRSWEVTITNLTGGTAALAPAARRPLERADVWSLRTIAKPRRRRDRGGRGQHGARVRPPGPPGHPTGRDRRRRTDPAGREPDVHGSRREASFDRLTVLTMLVNTNDGFTGLDSVKMRAARTPRGRRRPTTPAASATTSGPPTFRARAATTPSCGIPRARLIGMHEGITGRGDLDPAVYDWNGPVARIQVVPLVPARPGAGGFRLPQAEFRIR